MKRRRFDSGSMDMLLDTMCNTFGGVCFIALMVAIISAAIPKNAENEKYINEVEVQLTAKEIARLKQRRDVLKCAIEVQSEFAENALTGAVMRADLAKMAGDVAGNEEKIRLYERKRIEYLDELAKVRTSIKYSRREASRLSRLLKALEEKIGKPLFDRHRVVRTPNERKIVGLRIVDAWIHEHRLYLMDDGKCVSREECSDGGWNFRLLKGRGVLLDDDFFQSGREWRRLRGCIGSDSYVRIFVDTVSFDELCLLRDALINNGSMYNWIVQEKDVIHFVEGYDGRVQ